MKTLIRTMQTDLSLKGHQLVLKYICWTRAHSLSITLFPASTHLIDHEIISMVIHLPSAESFKKVCCQLQAKVCARSTG